MKADFICVYDLNEKSIRNVPFEEMIRNKDIVSAAEWAEFLECYTEVIDALIRETSVFINSLSWIAYNSYSSCFSSTAVSLYKVMKEKAEKAKIMDTAIFQHWYFSLHNQVYVFKAEVFHKTYNNDFETVTDDGCVPAVVWKNFIEKRKFGHMFDVYKTKEEINEAAARIFYSEMINKGKEDSND